MQQLSVQYIEFLCAKFEKIANESMEKCLYNRTIRFLKGLSYIRYKFFLGYKNDFIENIIQNLAQHIENKTFKENGDEKSIVIVDEINADYIGLMVQYLDALIFGDYQILYLYEQKEHPHVINAHLMQALEGCEKAHIKQIPSKVSGFSKSQWIYNEICAFGSKKVLLHLGEWAVEHSVACAALPKDCLRYRINCADHCFWAGVSCADYTFEFRHYGANLSYRERGLKQDHVIYIPFYPVMQDIPFEGLPKECSGKFIFFSGGAIYKISDDENTFFKLCKLILDNCPNSVILFAGANADNAVLSSGIEQFGLQRRFIPIGYRKDILEVFRHCNVYINTFPSGGGLMCQYAAQCSKPILNYKSSHIEECVAQKGNCSFTSSTKYEFLQEAAKLYSDAEYRKEKGKVIHNAVISKEDFDHALISFLSTKRTLYAIKWNDIFIPNSINIEDTIIYNNMKLAAFYFKLYHLLGSEFILTMPGNLFSLVLYGIKRQLKKILKLK